MTLNNLGDVGAYGYCRFPIAFSNTEYSIVANHQGSDAVMAYQLVTEINSTYCVLCAKNYSGGKAVPWVSTNNPGGNASSVSLPIAYRQWYKIVATGVVNSSDGDFKQTVAVLKDYNWSMSSFALRTSGSDRPAAFCITIGV